jgi:hypothetical protein
MAGKGGSGTLNRSGDGEDVAPVIPLRQRREDPTVPPPGRRTLPRERAAFDPELEAGDVAVRRRWPGRAARKAITSLHVRSRPVSGAVACATLVTAAVGLALLVLVLGVPVVQTFSSHGPRSVASSSIVQHRMPEIALTRVTTLRASRNRRASQNKKPAIMHRTRIANHRPRRIAPKRSVAIVHQSSRPAADTTPAATITPASNASPTAPSQPSGGSAAQSTGGSQNPGGASAFGSSGALGPGSSPDS